MLYPYLIEVIDKGLPGFLLKGMAQVAPVHMKKSGGQLHADLLLVVVFDIGFHIPHQVGVAVDIALGQVGSQVGPEVQIIIMKLFEAEDLVHGGLQIVVSPELLDLRYGVADDQPYLAGYVVAACLDVQQSQRLCFPEMIEQLLGQETGFRNPAGFDAEDQLPRFLPGEDAGRFFFGVTEEKDIRL